MQRDCVGVSLVLGEVYISNFLSRAPSIVSFSITGENIPVVHKPPINTYVKATCYILNYSVK